MANLENFREVVEGSKELARVQNLIELYGKCEKYPLYESDKTLSFDGKERLRFTKLVEEALIQSLRLEDVKELES